MRRTTRPAPRGGFTLVELLVVIAIMALLAALVAAGIGQVRTAQMSRVTNETMTKLQLALEGQWKGVMADAQKQSNVPADVLAFCDNDPDRARALWAYISAKREFPQTFQEARRPVMGGIPALNSGNGFPARATFAKVPNVLPTTNEEERDQAAVLLYLILAEKGYKGVQFAADDVTQGAQGEVVVNGFSGRVFKDAWGTPIVFLRHHGMTVPELQQPPYVPAARAGKNADPFDPFSGAAGKGKLADTTGTWGANKALAVAGLNDNLRRWSKLTNGFDGTNKVPTVVSGGADKDIDDDADDNYGFRLTRQGNKGD